MTHFLQLDTSPMQQNINRSAVINYLWKNRHSESGREFNQLINFAAIVYIVLAVLCLFTAVSNGLTLGSVFGAIVLLIMLLLACCAFVAVMSLFLITSGRLSMQLQELALRSGLTYVGESKDVAELESSIFVPSSGAIFQHGYHKTYRQIFGGKEFSFFDYTYVTSSGRNKRTHSWVVGCAKLSKHLPHVVFDAKVNNIFGLSNLPTLYDIDQRFVSQSKFNEVFNVYIPDGAMVDTLSFLAPDLMDVLMTDYKDVDIEIIGNTLYMYTGGSQNSESFVKRAEQLKVLYAELEDNISSFGASTPKTSPQAAQYALNYPTLRTNTISKTLATIGIGLIYTVVQLSGQYPPLFMAGTVAGIGLLGAALYKLKY